MKLLVSILVFFLVLAFCLNLTNHEKKPIISETGSLNVYFCPQDDCEKVVVELLDSAQESIHCALFDLGLKSIQEKLLEKEKKVDVKVIIDNEYTSKFKHEFVKEDSFGLMHNKFCIVDKTKIFTGSMNPTENDAKKNDNNLLLITSTILAQNYEDEFQEMWANEFKGGQKIVYSHFFLRENNTNYLEIQNYFCPEDDCAAKVKAELAKARNSIFFLTFSFTHRGIANQLLLKHLEDVEVKGVLETKQISKYSQYERLNSGGIEVRKDANKYNMHHKVFIIDNETVITGSFNPTAGGNQRNDENLLIIKNAEITQLFLSEFKKIFNNTLNMTTIS